MAIQIDESDDIKILSINWNQLPDGIEQVIAGHEEYRDQVLKEHLYIQEIATEMTASEWIEISDEIKEALCEIKALCSNGGYSYWRIIEKP